MEACTARPLPVFESGLCLRKGHLIDTGPHFLKRHRHRTRAPRLSSNGKRMPTPQRKPTVIVTRKLPDVVETRMCELFETRLNVDDKPMTQSQLVEAVKNADVLVPTVTDRIDRAVLTQAGPRLRLIANFGTGVENVDLDTARNRGILVTNTPGVLTEDTADMTMALILTVPRRLAEGAAYMRDAADKW